MQLKVLSYPDVEQVRTWRNDNMSMLRTPFLLTEQMQGEFYQEQVCNHQANVRYWGIWGSIHHTDEVHIITNGICNICDNKKGNFIGMGEISNIQWENRLGEIGLIMHPEHICDSVLAIEMILEQGFNHLNLENIFGECYLCNPRLSIWVMVCERFNARCCYLPKRKFWQGEYYDSLYFNINREEWKKCL
jgi:RimJ/RimL family protein N-acetyltransferase